MSDRIDRTYEFNELFGEINGADLLDELRDVFIRYVSFPNRHAVAGVTLWTAATHALPAFECAPRLVLTSPQKRCGKTRALDIIAGTCHRPLATSDATVAAVFRSLGGDHPRTLIIDEADGVFGTKKAAEQNEDLRKLLNAGHQRGRPALRCVGQSQTPIEFPVFAMAALAGIGAMPDTITDRAVNISMRRRAVDEKVSQFRSRRDSPVLERLRDQLAAWAADHLDELTDAAPEMPVEDRAADTWEPLIAVADAAGGHWPRTARAACVALVAAAESADEDRSLPAKLLSDIRDIFAAKGVPFLLSGELVAELRRLEESPWNDFELTVRKLAHRLKEFGVRPAHNAARSARGYRLEDLSDAFSRYIRPDPSIRPETTSDQAQPMDTSEPLDGSISPGDLNVHAEVPGQIAFSDGWTDRDGCAEETDQPRCDTCLCDLTVPESITSGRCRECRLTANDTPCE